MTGRLGPGDGGRVGRAAVCDDRPMQAADRDHSTSFETLAVHAGAEPDELTGAVSPPIYQTSTYAQDAVGSPRLGYEYSRSGNPTRDSLQECLAALEGGPVGLAFASGLAAEDTLLRTVCKPGDHVSSPTTRTAAPTGCSPGSPSGGG